MSVATWFPSTRGDKRALPIADRHYNRQKPGSSQFVPPGSCLVFLSEAADSLWVSSWPKAEYVKHAWAGAWICSCFRNESGSLSSTLIREAVACTLDAWGDPPALGFVTFVDPTKTTPKDVPGWCYRRAGWKRARCPIHASKTEGCMACKGLTKGGLVALQLTRRQMIGGGR